MITLCEFSASVKRLHVRGFDSTNIITLYRVNMQFLFCVYLADIVFRVPTLGLIAQFICLYYFSAQHNEMCLNADLLSNSKSLNGQ